MDVSHYNGTVNFADVAGAGVRFAYVEAAQGDYYTDAYYSTDVTQADAQGLLVGSSQVFDPTVDGASQADHLLDVATFHAGDLIPALDVVDDGNGGPTDNGSGVTTATFDSRLADWTDTVQAALDLKPLLYAQASEWNTYTGSDTTLGAAGYPLWIAYWSTATSPTLPGGWSGWSVWQHSGTGTVPGISPTGGADEDYVEGDVCALTVSAAQLNAPMRASSPQIGGTPGVGEALGCSPGTWTNFPGDFVYQWLRDGAAIPGARAAGYTVTSTDAGRELSCQVTAENGAGSTPALSAAVSVPSTPPATAPGTAATIASVGHTSVSGVSASTVAACEGTSGATCDIVIALSVSETLRGGKVIAVTAKIKPRTSKRTVTVGTTRVTLEAGHSEALTVALNGVGRALLARHHTLLVKLTAKSGASLIVSRTITFRKPRHQAEAKS